MSSENIAGLMVIGLAVLISAIGMSLVYRAKRREAQSESKEKRQ